jgi:5-(carboxyamino)imidazole ribonucleotide synthase
MTKTIGIVGGGQLGRMMAPAAKSLGFDVIVLDPTPQSPAGQIADQQVVGDFSDYQTVKKFGANLKVLTFEIESSNAKALIYLKKHGKQIHPTPHTLDLIKDKLKQKSFLRSRNLPTAEFLEIKTQTDIQKAVRQFGYPLVLKARFGAYDGRGNVVIHSAAQTLSAMKKLSGRKLYVEKYIPFVRELAIMVARDIRGNLATYPLVETMHKNNICHTVVAPAAIDSKLSAVARRIVEKTVSELRGVGVFCIELFQTPNSILINEIAPRVHNSGHYTIEACYTSQFEQHIRAITGLPLGDPSLKVPAAAMVNLLGERLAKANLSGLKKALSLNHVSVHIYGKKQTKPDRKMGHVTVVGQNQKSTLKTAQLAVSYLRI